VDVSDIDNDARIPLKAAPGVFAKLLGKLEEENRPLTRAVIVVLETDPVHFMQE